MARSMAYVHPTALVDSASQIGSGTTVWAFANIMAGAVIGERCLIGDHCFLENEVVIGNNVTIKNACLLFDGVTIESEVFLGPAVKILNDSRPRSPRAAFAQKRYATRDWLKRTHVGVGATIGSGVIILPGVRIGEYAFVGAGSVVTRDVSPYTVVRGNPAQPTGMVCRCASIISPIDDVSSSDLIFSSNSYYCELCIDM